MNLWLAAALALLCSSAGVVMGLWFSRLRSPYWTIGYFIPLVLVFGYALAFRVPSIMFMPPISWTMVGIKKFATFGFIATLFLTTPLSRIPQRRNRVVIVVLMVVIVFYTSIWSFLAPMAARKQLSRLQTRIDKDGVCLQTTDYTCGPAAAVTALRSLRLPAEEGNIAILSCTSGRDGTPTDMLAHALERKFAKDGLVVECRAFKKVSELRQAGLTLAVVKYSLLEDHWVTVLGVTDSEVVIGDPLAGLTRLSYEEFSKRWRYLGIVLRRKVPA